MKKFIFLLCFIPALVLSAGNAVWAQTPDGETPAEETVCDGQIGAAFGLCNAYCEAMDCDDENAQASPTACNKVGSKFANITGQSPPCACDPTPETGDACAGCFTPEELNTCTFCLNNPTDPICNPDDTCTTSNQCANCETGPDLEFCTCELDPSAPDCDCILDPNAPGCGSDVCNAADSCLGCAPESPELEACCFANNFPEPACTD